MVTHKCHGKYSLCSCIDEKISLFTAYLFHTFPIIIAIKIIHKANAMREIENIMSLCANIEYASTINIHSAVTANKISISIHLSGFFILIMMFWLFTWVDLLCYSSEDLEFPISQHIWSYFNFFVLEIGPF